MQKIKIFKGSEFELEKLENHVNKWLRDSRIRPMNIFGNIAPQSGGTDDKDVSAHAPSDVILFLVYDLLETK